MSIAPRIIPFLILFALLFIGSAARAQGVRIGPAAVTAASGGATNAVVLPPNPQLSLCFHPANSVPCTNRAVTYTDATLSTACSTSAQIVLDGTSSCVASPDAQNNYGYFVAPGQYDLTISYSGGNFGPYFITAALAPGASFPGGLAVIGQTSFTGIANPAAPTVAAVLTGSTSYTYFVVCHDGNNGVTLASSGTTITNGKPFGQQNNKISWTAVLGCVKYDVLTGTTATSLSTNLAVNVAAGQTMSINDIGQGTNPYTAPSANTTGAVIAATLGPSAAQQHTIPAVAPDTFALLAAAQTLTNKTFTAPTFTLPTITNPTTTGTDSGAETLTNKTLDISLNTLKTATNTAGHYPRNNGTQYVDAAIAGGDVPATTSNCSGVQFAQGLNAGMTPVCATPPAFVASGASHAVGYVPDPGASAGTTHFLREDATWQTVPASGVSESAWTCQFTSPGAAVPCSDVFLTNSHTLTRLHALYNVQGVGCTTTVVWAVKDRTGSTTLATLNGANNVATSDSGALSVAMTAGHDFTIEVTTAEAGCSTNPSVGVSATYQ